ncbi:MAG: hypothetical protein RR396_04665, partial [Clostridiales bacterium]
MFQGNKHWTTATAQTTKLTSELGASIYPYPILQGSDQDIMSHYMDWPLLMATIRYYEKYNDNTYGYYYYLNKDGEPIDTLKNGGNLYVVEEGYLIDLLSESGYKARFGGSKSTPVDLPTTEIFDNRYVIRLKHAQVESMLKDNHLTADGAKPVQIEISSKSGAFQDILHGEERAFFNPLFPKQILLLGKDIGIPHAVNNFEIRSPRHMLNIRSLLSGSAGGLQESKNPPEWYDDAVKWHDSDLGNPPKKETIGQIDVKITNRYSDYTRTLINRSNGEKVEESISLGIVGMKIVYKVTEVKYWVQTVTVSEKSFNDTNYSYQQTIDLDFAKYLKDGQAVEVKQNVVENFKAKSYDGKVGAELDRETQRPQAYKIKNLIMNVPDVSDQNKRTGSAFGNVNENSLIQNLEFVDPQIRYSKNGMGGGIVANINYGRIDNIKVYNTEKRHLFTDAYGKIDTSFCADRTDATDMKYMLFSHAHGGIAGLAYGPKAKITNCMVGTNSPEINEVFDNKTLISCHSFSNNSSSNENWFSLIGGIVGGISDNGEVISCLNIATV